VKCISFSLKKDGICFTKNGNSKINTASGRLKNFSLKKTFQKNNEPL